MNTEVLATFDKLLEAMLSEKARLAEAVKEATLSSQFAEAQRLLATSERVERLVEQVRRLRDAWERLDKAEDLSVTELEPGVVLAETKFGGTEDSLELAFVE